MQAKRNVEKYFLVVGVVDYVEAFLKVLEKEIPHYFNGASYIYRLGGQFIKLYVYD